MRKKSRESINHLMIHCEVAKELWSSILNLFGVNWVMPISVKRFDGVLRRSGRVWYWYGSWRLAPLCVMWCIWRERNARSFEDVEMLVIGYPTLELAIF